jgi:hypothetical protein
MRQLVLSVRTAEVLIINTMLLALAATAVGCATRGSGGSGGRPGDGPAYNYGGNPLTAGHTTSLAAANRIVGFRILMPRSTSAIRNVNLSQTWVYPEERQVALVFDSGNVTVMQWPIPADRRSAISYYKGIIKDHLGNDHIGRVDGVQALIIKQHTDVKHTNPAWIEFYKNGIDVNIYSAHYKTSDLVKLANTLR